MEHTKRIEFTVVMDDANTYRLQPSTDGLDLEIVRADGAALLLSFKDSAEYHAFRVVGGLGTKMQELARSIEDGLQEDAGNVH